MIGYKIAHKMTKVSKNSQKNNSETVTKQYDKETPKERYIYTYLQKKEKKLLMS